MIYNKGDKIKCSFCLHSVEIVEITELEDISTNIPIIQGDEGNICSKCVDTCKEMLDRLAKGDISDCALIYIQGLDTILDEGELEK